MCVEEEGQPGREIIDREARIDCGLDIGDPVRQRESYFLNSGRSGFTDVITGDRDRIPVRHRLSAISENIGGHPQRSARRIDVSTASDIFFENIILYCP